MGIEPPLYFWRDQNGYVEVDCLVDAHSMLTPVELKSGESVSSDFFDGITKWNELAKADPSKGYVVYGGDLTQSRSLGKLLGWRSAGDLMEKIETEKK